MLKAAQAWERLGLIPQRQRSKRHHQKEHLLRAGHPHSITHLGLGNLIQLSSYPTVTDQITRPKDHFPEMPSPLCLACTW